MIRSSPSSDLSPKTRRKAVQKEVQVFKRPSSLPGQIQKKKRKVLSEDKFAEALEKIIQRECFPDLEKLKAQNAYLDAVANNDVQMIRELHHKYGSLRNTPSVSSIANDTPSTFETPSGIIGMSFLRKNEGSDGRTPVPGGDVLPEPCPLKDDDTQSVITTSSKGSGKGRKKPHDMGLNEFLNTFTSEDDKSFQDIIDEGLRKQRIKYAWLYKDEDAEGGEFRLAIALPTAEEQQSLEYQRPRRIETWTYKNKNAVMFIPEGVPYNKEELANLAKKRIEVVFKNTRFYGKPYKAEASSSDDQTLQLSASRTLNLIRGMTEGKFGMDGKEVASTETPSVNGFKYVRTPSPSPGGDDTPFLTWGEIEGTPFRLDAGDTPMSRAIGTPYRMIDTSHREKLAIELAEKASSRYRDKKQKTIEVAKSYLSSPSPRPKTCSDRMLNMSPAAQRFARSLLKKSEPGTPRTPRL